MFFFVLFFVVVIRLVLCVWVCFVCSVLSACEGVHMCLISLRW